jgi:hypothetical protein
MKRAIKSVGIVCAILLLLLIGSIALDTIPASRAIPPKNVTDVSSCLAWLKQPMGAYRITTDKGTYFQITRPAGRYLPSGPAAYSFDSQGKFIGWTKDMGDFYEPPEVFVRGAKTEKISLGELKETFKH